MNPKNLKIDFGDRLPCGMSTFNTAGGFNADRGFIEKGKMAL
jgi:hypothetical protein